MKLYLPVVLSIVFLVSCHPRTNAMWNMQSSKSNYKECLEKAADPAQCETQRKLFEIDKDAVEATSQGNIKVK
jgi:hypothetical protein